MKRKGCHFELEYFEREEYGGFYLVNPARKLAANKRLCGIKKILNRSLVTSFLEQNGRTKYLIKESNIFICSSTLYISNINSIL
jgi:hypothetical protein